MRASETQGATWTPACNVWEDEYGFYVQLALPDREPQDVTLQVANQVLSTKGERNQAPNQRRRCPTKAPLKSLLASLA